MGAKTIFKEWEAKRTSLGLPVDLDMLLLLTKTRLLANSGDRTSEVDQFIELCAKVNILRSAGGSLRCLSSGLTSYSNLDCTGVRWVMQVCRLFRGN